MEETDTDKETLGIYVSAGRFKAIVDMMDAQHSLYKIKFTPKIAG
jgi:hypothetical protein